MSQIVSMTGPISSLRAQLRAQAEAALTPETKSTFSMVIPKRLHLLRGQALQ